MSEYPTENEQKMLKLSEKAIKPIQAAFDSWSNGYATFYLIVAGLCGMNIMTDWLVPTRSINPLVVALCALCLVLATFVWLKKDLALTIISLSSFGTVVLWLVMVLFAGVLEIPIHPSLTVVSITSAIFLALNIPAFFVAFDYIGITN